MHAHVLAAAHTSPTSLCTLPYPDPRQVVDEEATAKAQEAADAKAKEEGKEAADKVAPGGRALGGCGMSSV